MAGGEVLLTDVFRKASEDVRNLEMEKKAINDMIKQVRKQIRSMDRKEARLHMEMAVLAERESQLINRKISMEKKLERRKKKYEKMVAKKKSLSEAF